VILLTIFFVALHKVVIPAMNFAMVIMIVKTALTKVAAMTKLQKYKGLFKDLSFLGGIELQSFMILVMEIGAGLKSTSMKTENSF
jgi:hypothetical protein